MSSNTVSCLRLAVVRHRIETKGRFLLVVVAIPVAMALLGSWAYQEMRADVAKGTPKAMTFSPELREFVTELNPVKFATLSATDLLYKPYFSIGMVLVGLITWRVVGVTFSEGIHKYFLLGGSSRTRTAVNTGCVLLLLVAEFVGLVLLVNLLVGVVGFAGASGSITGGELVAAIGLYSAAILPLMNYSLLIAILARLHLPSIPLLVAALVLPIPLGVLDTMTASKFCTPWGSLAFFSGVPEFTPVLATALVVEAGWLLVLASGFWILSAREQISG